MGNNTGKSNVFHRFTAFKRVKLLQEIKRIGSIVAAGRIIAAGRIVARRTSNEIDHHTALVEFNLTVVVFNFAFNGDGITNFQSLQGFDISFGRCQTVTFDVLIIYGNGNGNVAVFCIKSLVDFVDLTGKSVCTARESFACCKVECCVNDSSSVRLIGSFSLRTKRQGKGLGIGFFAASNSSRQGNGGSRSGNGQFQTVCGNSRTLVRFNRPRDGYASIAFVAGRKLNRFINGMLVSNVQSFFNLSNLIIIRNFVSVDHLNQAADVVTCAASIRDHGCAERVVRAMVTKIVIGSFTVLIYIKMGQNRLLFDAPEEFRNGRFVEYDIIVLTVIAESYADILFNVVFIVEEHVEVIGIVDVLNKQVNSFFASFSNFKVVAFHLTGEVSVFCQRTLVNVELISGFFSGLFVDCIRDILTSLQSRAVEGNGYGLTLAIGNSTGQNVGQVCIQRSNVYKPLFVAIRVVAAVFDGYAACNVNSPSNGKGFFCDKRIERTDNVIALTNGNVFSNHLRVNGLFSFIQSIKGIILIRRRRIRRRAARGTIVRGR